MQEFRIPITFADGSTVDVPIYVGEAIEGVHPLEQQADWWRRERGVVFPQEVMDSFGKLAEIALENNMSFEELCVKAMKQAQEPEAEAEQPGSDG